MQWTHHLHSGKRMHFKTFAICGKGRAVQQAESRTSTEQMSERVPFQASKEFLDRVDDWSFTNRVRSRAEAIRRLVTRGLQAEEAEG